MPGKRRILFVAENVTLAQVVRLVALARRLDPERYDVHFACGSFAPLAFAGTSFTCWTIPTTDGADSLRRLERGERIYETKLLGRYVEAELGLLDRVRPELVIGDFRLSLAVSAPLMKLPLATLINAYWSPFAVREAFPVPDHPIVKWLGVERAKRHFPQAMPAVFAHFAAPVNELRKRHGLRPLGSLLEVLTHGDFTLYPDIPELCPSAGLPPNHSYLGAVNWSPELELPAALTDAAASRPIVYVTLGSSGQLSVLALILRVIAELPVFALLATAGRVAPSNLPDNVLCADFLPGSAAARIARFVVTNGGSSTGYQALCEGKPVLGIPSNLDQYLAMTAIERASAGVLVRSGTASAGELRDAMLALLDSRKLHAGAQALAQSFAEYDCHARFDRFLNDAL